MYTKVKTLAMSIYQDIQPQDCMRVVADKNGRKRVMRAIGVLDRCGNNWKNWKGGCGILMHNESAPCLATMFQPFVLLTKEKGEDK